MNGVAAVIFDVREVALNHVVASFSYEGDQMPTPVRIIRREFFRFR